MTPPAASGNAAAIRYYTVMDVTRLVARRVNLPANFGIGFLAAKD